MPLKRPQEEMLLCISPGFPLVAKIYPYDATVLLLKENGNSIFDWLTSSSPDYDKEELLEELASFVLADLQISEMFMKVSTHFTQLSLLYPQKTLENLWFSDVIRRYRKKPVAWNGLRGINNILKALHCSMQELWTKIFYCLGKGVS